MYHLQSLVKLPLIDEAVIVRIEKFKHCELRRSYLKRHVRDGQEVLVCRTPDHFVRFLDTNSCGERERFNFNDFNRGRTECRIKVELGI